MAIQIGRNSRTFIGSFLAVCWLWTAAAFSQESHIVRAEDYRNFWLWAGVQPQPALKQADEIYVLAGEVSRHTPPRIFSQRSATPRIKGPKVWIVYRVQSIAWDDATLAEILRQAAVWKNSGNNLVGLQLDFDAATKGLHQYAEFLGKIRARLPSEYDLSITGLLDWSANGDPAGFDALAGVVDEIVLQIYQGRKVIPGYQAYLEKLDKIKIKFRIGLVQGGEWQEPLALKANPYFNGHVVFLLNQDP